MAVTVSVPTKKPEKAKQNHKVKNRKKKEIDKDKLAGGSGSVMTRLGAGRTPPPPSGMPTTWIVSSS